jgi:hypothetical protein
MFLTAALVCVCFAAGWVLGCTLAAAAIDLAEYEATE